MTHGTLPPGQPAEPDDLDRLFAAYFRQQLPKPWPKFQPVPMAGLRPPAERSHSRATLAVAVAALFGFGLYLSSGSLQPPAGNGPPPTAPGLLKDATAKGPDLSKPMSDPPEPGKGTRTP
jgi:hypothetical protein